MIQNNTDSSACHVNNTKKLAEIIKHNYIDHPSQKDYNFSQAKPRLNGQIGAPKIVDEFLGHQNNKLELVTIAYIASLPYLLAQKIVVY